MFYLGDRRANCGVSWSDLDSVSMLMPGGRDTEAGTVSKSGVVGRSQPTAFTAAADPSILLINIVFSI